VGDLRRDLEATGRRGAADWLLVRPHAWREWSTRAAARDPRFETVLEVNHRFQLAPWLYVTPDFQYIFRPNGSDDEPDAAVVGAEIRIDF
jgi:carbohydrate-selective porin OprB